MNLLLQTLLVELNLTWENKKKFNLIVKKQRTKDRLYKKCKK